jgi:hypothetical protein
MWYNYSSLWDFEGDGKNDSLYFIGNGGVHTRYHFRIMLSSDMKVRDFPTVNLDMPWLSTDFVFDERGERVPHQFIFKGFNTDGGPDIYLDFDQRLYSRIPLRWKLKGVRTKSVLISFKEKKIVVEDYRFDR